MARTGWQDWYAEVDAAFVALASRCEQTFVFGISMGGCLALRLAEVHGREVRGLVLVNPSLAPDTKLSLLAPVLKHVLRTLRGVASDIKKPGVERGRVRPGADSTRVRPVSLDAHLRRALQPFSPQTEPT